MVPRRRRSRKRESRSRRRSRSRLSRRRSRSSHRRYRSGLSVAEFLIEQFRQYERVVELGGLVLIQGEGGAEDIGLVWLIRGIVQLVGEEPLRAMLEAGNGGIPIDLQDIPLNSLYDVVNLPHDTIRHLYTIFLNGSLTRTEDGNTITWVWDRDGYDVDFLTYERPPNDNVPNTPTEEVLPSVRGEDEVTERQIEDVARQIDHAYRQSHNRLGFFNWIPSLPRIMSVPVSIFREAVRRWSRRIRASGRLDAPRRRVREM